MFFMLLSPFHDYEVPLMHRRQRLMRCQWALHPWQLVLRPSQLTHGLLPLHGMDMMSFPGKYRCTHTI